MLETMQRQMEQNERQMSQMTALIEENRTLREAATATADTVQQTNNASYRQTTKKPDRPSIVAGMNDRDWEVFLDHWSRYKVMARITGADTIRMEIRACCTSDVNKILFEFVGSETLNRCTEQQLLGHVKSVVVKSMHKEVHRMAFDKITQNDGESITSFIARLKAHAFLCEFTVPCPHSPSVQVSYADEMVSQRLMSGVLNQEHQRRVLSEAETLVTLARKVERFTMLETTEESSDAMRSGPVVPQQSEAALAKSQYKRQQKKDDAKGNKDKTTGEGLIKCRWCGLTSHPRGKSLERINCPAREKKCHNCKIKGHLATVCEKTDASAVIDTQEESGEEDELPAGASVSFSFATEDFRRGQMGSNTW